MTVRIIGAILIVAGCGGFGFSMAMEQRRQEGILHRMISAIQYMQWELSYRLTPLPELCRQAARHGGGEVQKILLDVAGLLETNLMPDAGSCMSQALQEQKNLPRSIRVLFRRLGSCLGCFDLTGQLEGLKALEQACNGELKRLQDGKEQRLRSYETLGLCAGAAMVILFI